MISVEQAKEAIAAQIPEPKSGMQNLRSAMGCVTSRAIESPIGSPPFNQSAMDGYALGGDISIFQGAKYTVVGEVRAGGESNFDLGPGQAVRIFTGAAVPETASAVVMQELVNREGDTIEILQPVKVGANIRRSGEEIRRGQIALEKHTLLNPAALGYLSGLGLTAVEVYSKPIIGILATGDELTTPGQPLKPGHIYESNAAMLAAAMEQNGFEVTEINRVVDREEATVEILRALADRADLVLVSGGISVGDYDHVGTAMEQIGVQTVFHTVNQKPGKPLFFGRRDRKLFFGLPGNPAAALTSLYEYALPAARMMSGRGDAFPKTEFHRAINEFHKKGDRAQFLKAQVTTDGVHILEHQSSAMLRSFAEANALVYMPVSQQSILAGEVVEVHVLPL